MHNENDSQSLIVVYGGQWGSEGKGQITAFLAERRPVSAVDYAIRVGGPNAGHTARAADGTIVKAQQIPIPMFVNPSAVGVIGAGGYIHPETLQRELEALAEIWPNHTIRLFIDENAVVITPEHEESERDLRKAIASTAHGVGAATADKVWRRAVLWGEWIRTAAPNAVFTPETTDMLVWADTVGILNMMADQRDGPCRFIVEGTQGAMLSLSTSGGYPFVTSRECTPDAILGEIGLSQRAFHPTRRVVVGVYRTHPIRVGGNSGHLPYETSWENLEERSGGYISTPERTTVTKTIRRIGYWDWATFHRSIAVTRPDVLAITFCDYLFPECAGITNLAELPRDLLLWLERVEEHARVPVRFISTGAGQEFTMDLGDDWRSYLDTSHARDFAIHTIDPTVISRRLPAQIE